jgi:hypothetical protein
MNADVTIYNCGLLFAGLCLVFGIVGIVSSDSREYRRLASGLILQGVVFIFVFGSAYFPGSIDLRLGGLTVTGLLIIQNLLSPNEFRGPGTRQVDQVIEENHSA